MLLGGRAAEQSRSFCRTAVSRIGTISKQEVIGISS
jgi:hypothetical protein